jgi:hypothetical protein
MPTRPDVRKLVCPALLLPLLAIACEPSPPPTTPELPQVSLTVLEPSTVGTSLKLSVSVSGCDAVRSLRLYDREELLKSVPYGANPTPVELAKNEIPYTRGIAALLSLTARVTCADERTNISQPQPATFFPVEEVVEPLSADTQVVPDIFVAEGSGAGVAFLGCTLDANGRSWLSRVPGSNPGSVQRLEMPFPCNTRTSISERRSGWRWVWTPEEGFLAIDESFSAFKAISYLPVDRLTVMPEGDALVWDAGAGGTPKTFRRISPAGEEKWMLMGGSPALEREFHGFLIAEPVLRGDGMVAVPVQQGTPDMTAANILVGVLDYETGLWSGNFSLIDSISPFNAPAPPVALDATGTLLYLATQGTIAPYVRACTIGGSGEGRCEGENRRWISANLQGSMAALVPYANGTRVAAIGPHHLWSLDAASGAVRSRDNQPLSPEGALVARFAQPGPGNDFYLLNSAAPTQSQPYPLPMEILATDAAEKGELFRYQVPGGSLYGAVDDGGALWLRVGRKLVKPLSPEQYRVARGG